MLTPPSLQSLSDAEFYPHLQQHSKAKERSKDTYQNVHLPELNLRLNLGLEIVPSTSTSPEEDPFAPRADPTTKTKISVIYLGNSKLERLKTTGQSTQLSQVKESWNAGCGGDKNEHVNYRLGLGMYDILKKHNQSETLDIKLWILASGTNDLHPKRGLRKQEIDRWRTLVETCLRIAPQSKVVACDVFYRNDVSSELVDKGNEMMKDAVMEINKEAGEEKVIFVEARHLMDKTMLLDHVHIDSRGYEVWDTVLFPYVRDALSLADVKESGP